MSQEPRPKVEGVTFGGARANFASQPIGCKRSFSGLCAMMKKDNSEEGTLGKESVWKQSAFR